MPPLPQGRGDPRRVRHGLGNRTRPNPIGSGSSRAYRVANAMLSDALATRPGLASASRYAR